MLEADTFSSFFALLKSSTGLFGGFPPPGRKASPVVFCIVSNTTKILHFYLERAGRISADTFLNILSSAELPPIHILTFDSRRNFRRYFP